MSNKSTLKERLTQAGQQHVFRFWDELGNEQQEHLVKQLESLDLDHLQHWNSSENNQSPDWAKLAETASPPPAFRPDNETQAISPVEAQAAGLDAILKGKIGMILVAGGQGTRLGFDHPKGLYELGAISERSLIQILFEQLLAINRRHRVDIPLYVMTSPATDAETVAFIEDNQFFGLQPESVTVFCQGTMPAVDQLSGRLILDEKASLFLSPDGHGGMLAALEHHGCLRDANNRGVEHLFYCQVDNPLAQICDATLLGYHLLSQSELTTQAVQKAHALERVGNVVSIDDSVQIIEYSDLPENVAQQTNDDGSLRLWAGNIAVHVFDVCFLTRMLSQSNALPFHLANKKVPYLDETGRKIEPDQPNAIKFERFIFDLLPLAKNAIVVEAHKSESFAPVKNAKAESTDTAETSQRAMISLHQRWLREAGVSVADDIVVEINPLFADSVKELKAKIKPGTVITQPTYFI